MYLSYWLLGMTLTLTVLLPLTLPRMVPLTLTVQLTPDAYPSAYPSGDSTPYPLGSPIRGTPGFNQDIATKTKAMDRKRGTLTQTHILKAWTALVAVLLSLLVRYNLEHENRQPEHGWWNASPEYKTTYIYWNQIYHNYCETMQARWWNGTWTLVMTPGMPLTFPQKGEVWQERLKSVSKRIK